MVSLFTNRKVRFEIQAMANGQWRLMHILENDNGRTGLLQTDYEKAERNAIGQAMSLLASGRYEAVRVLRERVRADGFSTTSDVFRKKAAVQSAVRLELGRLEDPVAPCATEEDLLRRDSLFAISILLRGALDQLSVCAVELLHFYPYQRRQQQNAAIVNAAIHSLGRMQAQAVGGDARLRVRTLDELISRYSARAREAMGVRRLPGLDNMSLDASAVRIRQHVSNDWRFYLMVTLSGSPGCYARLERMLALAESAQDPDALAQADIMIGSLLDSPQVVMDLLGRPRNLGEAMTALANMANGTDTPAGSETAGPLPRLMAGIAGGRLVHASLSLWDRILREATRNRPLSMNEPAREFDVLMAVSTHLVNACPEHLRDRLVSALGRRVERLRSADQM